MNPPRALDPETHLPFPKPDWKAKIVSWFWEKEGRKLAVKLSAMVVPVVAIICGKIGVTPSATEAIGIGLCALVPQCLDFVISRIGRKFGFFLKPLTKIMEEQEADAPDGPYIDPNPTLTNIPRQGRPDLSGFYNTLSQGREFPGRAEIERNEDALEKAHVIERVKPGMMCVSYISPGQTRWKRQYFANCNASQADELHDTLCEGLPDGSWVDKSKAGELIPIAIPDFTKPE